MTEHFEPTDPLAGDVHFSDLKMMDLSPAHYVAACAEKFEPSRTMRVGTVVHHLVLGPNHIRPLVRYDGERKGNAWKAFEAEHPGCEIVTAAEWSDAEPIAAAVIADPQAQRIIEGARREMSLTWESAGIKCATRGIDIVGAGLLADLKKTSCTEPRSWQRHAIKLWYHAQMAWYEEGAKANGLDTSKGLFLIGVEDVAPWAVTCLRLTPPVIAHGRKSITKWMERLRLCRENDHWPTYTQTVVDFELPVWLAEEGGGDE